MTVQMQSQNFRPDEALRGAEWLNDSRRNKGTAFTPEERRAYELDVRLLDQLIARRGPPAKRKGFLAHALAGLRMWQEAFAEAQQMRRESGKRYPFIDS
jgi:hypothetical protein